MDTHSCLHTYTYLRRHAHTCMYIFTHMYKHVLHLHTHTHTHTHTHKMDKWTNVRSCHIGSRPPSGPVCYFRELWASTRQTPEAGPSTRRSTDCALQLWCGHPKSHLDLSGISTASGLVHPQPRPGSQFFLGLGRVPREKIFFLQWRLVGIEPGTFRLPVNCFNH